MEVKEVEKRAGRLGVGLEVGSGSEELSLEGVRWALGAALVCL